MAISLQEAIDNELLSKKLIEILPNNGYCECGSELEFTDSLRQVYCTNRYCYLKVAARLEDMAKEMKVSGWNKDTCIDICKHFKLKSPYQVFLLENQEWDGVDGFRDKVNNICNIEKRKFRLWEVVKLSGIPNIENIAYKIFDGYDSLEEAYNDIKKYQVPFIADRLGLKNADTGVLAVKVYNTLLDYEAELLFGEKKFEIIKTDGDKIYLAISGNVEGFPNKTSFINYINMKYKGKVKVILMNSVVSDIDALIVDGDTNNRKYKTACKLNEKAMERAKANGENTWHKIMITSSKEYLNYLDKKYGDVDNV